MGLFWLMAGGGGYFWKVEGGDGLILEGGG